MERHKNTCLLFLLLSLLNFCRTDRADCPSLPQKNLTCYTDYNRYITCEWNSGHDYTDAVCKLEAKRVNKNFRTLAYNASCVLDQVKKCTMEFSKPRRGCKHQRLIGIQSLVVTRAEVRSAFYQNHELSINLICNPAKHNLTISFKPACHVKPWPPGKPNISSANISWLAEVKAPGKLQKYAFQLQWKSEELSWSDPSQDPQLKNKTCNEQCASELNPDSLIQGERYEARVRVLATDSFVESTWSDWSPTASWVSLVGRSKPPQTGGVGQVLGIIFAGSVFALFMAVMLLRNKKVTWFYKKLRGPPIPDPGKSFLKDVKFPKWVSPSFTTQLFQLPLQPEEIVLVEETSTVDAVTLHKREAALKEKMRMETSYDSSFSNPSYSPLSTPPPAPLPTTDNLEPFAADEPVGSQDGGKITEEDKEEKRKKELEILQLLSKGNDNSEPVQVISDYEKVEKPHVESFRLQSLDSGVCSGEEVSQESLEADSISAVDCHDEGSEGKEEPREGGNGKVDFRMLFGGSGSVFGKGSIQVCSDYEQVQKPLPGSPELLSLDSGICSGGEEQASHEETPEDFEKSFESMRFQFPPPLSCALPCSFPSIPQLPLKFSGTDLSSALQPQSPDHVLKKIGLISQSMSMAPSSDGYSPVRQEQS